MPASRPTPEPAASDLVTLSTSERRGAGPPCPVDRMPARRRNQICIAILALGLLNLMAYTFAYAVLGGDAHNGHRELVQTEDGETRSVYYVRGHFVHSLTGRERAVSRAAWIYSYLHSISIPISSGAMIISMLVLARPHIVATMRGGWVSGRTFVTIFSTVVTLIAGGTAVLFTWHFIDELAKA